MIRLPRDCAQGPLVNEQGPARGRFGQAGGPVGQRVAVGQVIPATGQKHISSSGVCLCRILYQRSENLVVLLHALEKDTEAVLRPT